MECCFRPQGKVVVGVEGEPALDDAEGRLTGLVHLRQDQPGSMTPHSEPTPSAIGACPLSRSEGRWRPIPDEIGGLH
jgi:hypothetical protein